MPTSINNVQQYASVVRQNDILSSNCIAWLMHQQKNGYMRLALRTS
jgi:hypothetical protein